MDIRAAAKGATRSKTVYLGLAITVMGYLQANVNALAPFIRPEYLGTVSMGLGLAVILVRFVTDQSLADKAGE